MPLDTGFTIHPFDPCVFMGEYRDSSVVLSCYVDGILLQYGTKVNAHSHFLIYLQYESQLRDAIALGSDPSLSYIIVAPGHLCKRIAFQ